SIVGGVRTPGAEGVPRRVAGEGGRMLDRLDAPSSRWSWRAAMAALVAVVASFAAAPRSAAAEPAIEVLEAGWDGAAVYGTWTPVRLRVTGGDQDARALVEVVVEAQYQSGPQGNTVT